MKKILYFIVLLLCFSCEDAKLNDPQLPYVKFTYMWPGMETCNDLSAEDVLNSPDNADTIITDSCFYEKFMQFLDSLPNDTSQTSGDFRIVAQIYHRDSTMSVMSCDDRFGVCKVDNVFKKDSPELLDFLNHLLYTENGFRRLLVKSMMSYDSAYVYTEEGQQLINKGIEKIKAEGLIYY